MPTARQKKVAELIVKNATLDKPLNGGQIVESSRYSKSMVIKPGVVIESEGVQQALADLGFTEENAKRVVASIMLNEKADDSARLKATDQVFKVHGSYEEKPVTLNQMFIDTKSAKEMTDEEITQFLRSKLNASTENI